MNVEDSNKLYLDLAEKIKDDKIREVTKIAICNLPSYFWIVSSSSSNKYHPIFSNGDGGLVRHSCYCTEIALDLFNIIELTQFEQDIIVSALLLHDCLKQGLSGVGKHTVKDHSLIARDFLDRLWEEFNGKKEILGAIASHNGKWNDNGKLPIPVTKIEKIVFWCDYLSSRKTTEKYYKD